MKVVIDLGEWWTPLTFRDVKPMYEISNLGQIRNTKTNKILRTAISEKGYYMVSLMTVKGTQDTFKLHRIVATNFLPTPDGTDKWTVNHKNGVKNDNSVENLEWITFTDNIRHSYETGLNTGLKGEANGSNKYPEVLVRQICQWMEDGHTNREILATVREKGKYDINRHFLYELRRRKTWLHVVTQYNY